MTGNEAGIRMILAKHLSGDVSSEKLDKMTKELAGLGEEWEEINRASEAIGANVSVQCSDICAVGELHGEGVPIRIFRKKKV